MDHKEFFDKWKKTPSVGRGRLTESDDFIENLYQAFKDRITKELSEENNG